TTQLSSNTTFQGSLQDLQDGVALTQTTDSLGRNTVYLDGAQVAQETASKPPVIAGTGVAWVAAGVFTSANPSMPVYPKPAGADLLELAARGGLLAYVVEGSNQVCSVYVNGADIFDDANGCPQELKFVVAGGVTYLGWCDGAGVTIEQS